MTLPDYEQVEVFIGSSWVDVSDRVRTNQTPLEAPSGRQTTLEEVQNSRLALTFDNRDRRFTPGNSTSDLYPDWDQGCPIRWRTTITGGTVGQFRGVVEMPQDVIQFAEVGDDDDANMYCAVTAVDRLTQLDRAPAFDSNIGAHARGTTSAATLVAHWPMNGPAAPFSSLTGAAQDLTPRSLSLIHPSSVDGPPGDDTQYVDLDGTGDSVPFNGLLQADLGAVSVGSGEALAVSVWVRPTQGTGVFGLVSVVNGPLAILIYNDASSVYARCVANTGTVNATYTGSALPADVWRLVTARMSLPSGDLTLWIGDTITATATLSPAPTTIGASTIYVGDQGGVTTPAKFALGQLRIYAGAEAVAFTRADHLAMWQLGMNGLDGQTVDQRIRTVANYAGVSDAELNLERSSTVMPRASLAGKRPGEAMRVAAAADTGPLFSNGDGEIVFQSRRHRYNV